MHEENPHMSDEKVALLIQKGDKEKFSILMERYQEKLTRYGRKFLNSSENIEDIVQDVFISTFENLNSFDSSQKFSSWIYRIAHNAYVNHLKKSLTSRLVFIDLDTLISHPIYEDPKHQEEEDKEMKKKIDRGLEKIPPKYSEVLILHYLEDLSYKEISDILQVPTGTVGIRIRRAKEAMKKIWQDEYKEYGK